MVTPAPRLVLATIALLLGGCASTPYSPRPNEDTASLRIVTRSDFFKFRGLEASACPDQKRIAMGVMADGFNSGVSIGMIDPPKDVQGLSETLIPSGTNLIFVVGSEVGAFPGVPGYRCFVGVTFAPQKGSQYEIQYAREDRGCRAALFELQGSNGGKAERVRVRNANYFNAYSPYGNGMCSSR